MDDFDEFVREAAPKLLQLGLALSGSLSTAEDLSQETLAAVAQKWAKIDPPGRHAYAKRVLVNRHLSQARRRKVLTVPLEDGLDARHTTVSGGDPEDVTLRRERGAGVLAAVRALPGRQRAIVVLKYYEGMDTNAIAKTLGIRKSSVRSALGRAHATLNKQLESTGRPEGSSEHVRPRR